MCHVVSSNLYKKTRQPTGEYILPVEKTKTKKKQEKLGKWLDLVVSERKNQEGEDEGEAETSSPPSRMCWWSREKPRLSKRKKQGRDDASAAAVAGFLG